MAESSAFDAFICPICLEIYQDPVIVSCGHEHIYCQGCVTQFQSLAEPQCPKCRTVFDPTRLQRATDVERHLKSKRAQCRWCGKQMVLSKLREHMSSCTQMETSVPKFKPVKETSQPLPSNLPNRSTFQCPYCGQRNLDCSALVKHCNDQHRNSSAQVVCPVCASMPWGDPERLSANFIQHMNLRHKFEYDTYVDFGQDDETMLQEALKASLEEC